MFSGGDYAEVGRWLENFARSHAKRESPRLEAVIDAEGPREGRSYGIRLRAGERLMPPAGAPPLELTFEDARDHRGSLAWCQALADRVRDLARADRGTRLSA
jgi:hypothetical protein